MLEIMRQFSFQICRDFHDIFDKLDIVLAEHRCDKEHGRRMALLAYHTGLLHGAIVSYDEQIRANPNLVRPIFLLNFILIIVCCSKTTLVLIRACAEFEDAEV